MGAVFGIAVWQFPGIVLFLPFLWLFLREKRWIFAAFAIITILSVWVQGRPTAGPAAKTGTWIRAVYQITDPGLCRLPDAPRPGMVSAELLKAYGREGEELNLKGRILVRLPEEFTGRPFPGDEMEGAGVLTEPHGDFGRYARARRIRWIFVPEACRTTGADPWSIPRMIAGFRELLLERAVNHLRTPERRMEAATLFFGVRGGLSGEERQQLVHAGVIHLYSVSGLHVGIFAGVLMIFLRGLPCRWKYGVLIPATLLYVLSTGGNVPALRAWTMISVWAACRMFLYWIPVCRVLGYTAAVLLIWQPAWLYDMGFLYSFEITLVLLLLGQNLQVLRKSFSDPAWMMPRSRSRDRMYRILRVRNGFWSAVFACAVAFIGGTATSLIFQGRFLPGSVLANLFLMPVIAFLFPVMALKIATGWICDFWDKILAWCIDFAWDLMDAVIMAVQHFEALLTGKPALWSAVLFLASLILSLSPGVSRKMRYAGAALCTVLLIFWHGTMLFQKPEVMILHGNFAENPAVAVADTRAGIGMVVNVPDSASAVEMADFFLAHGISTVDRVVVSSPRSGNIRGLKTLMLRIRVRQFEMPEWDRYSGGFRKKMKELTDGMSHLYLTDRPGNIRIISGKHSWQAEYKNPASGISFAIEFFPAEDRMKINGKEKPLLRSSELVKNTFFPCSRKICSGFPCF